MDLEGSGAKGEMKIKRKISHEMIIVTKLGPRLTRKSSVNIGLIRVGKNNLTPHLMPFHEVIRLKLQPAVVNGIAVSRPVSPCSGSSHLISHFV